MHCVYCSSPLAEGAHFCSRCGKILPVDSAGDRTEVAEWPEGALRELINAQPAFQQGLPPSNQEPMMQQGPGVPPNQQGTQGFPPPNMPSLGPIINQGPAMQGPPIGPPDNLAIWQNVRPDSSTLIERPPDVPGPQPGGPPRAKRSKGSLLTTIVFILIALVVVAGTGIGYVIARPNLPPPLGTSGQAKKDNNTNQNNNNNNNNNSNSNNNNQTPVRPANNASFQVKISLTGIGDGNKFSASQMGRESQEEVTLIVKDGKVCQSRDDGRQLIQSFPMPTQLTPNDKWQYIRTFSCNGTYQDGKLSYTETVTAENIAGQGSSAATAGATYYSTTCPFKPYTFDQLEGTFSNATNISGTFTWSAGRNECQGRASMKGTGTWTSQIA